MGSGFLSHRRRQETIRQAKLDQERSYEAKVKLDRMSRHDPGYAHQQDKMVSEAQKCGRGYAAWLKAQGRPITIRENNS